MYQLDIPNFKIYRSKKLKKKQISRRLINQLFAFVRGACISSNLTGIINPRGVDQLESLTVPRNGKKLASLAARSVRWNPRYPGVSILISLRICCALTRADDLRGRCGTHQEPEILLYANKRFPTRLPPARCPTSWYSDSPCSTHWRPIARCCDYVHGCSFDRLASIV